MYASKLVMSRSAVRVRSSALFIRPIYAAYPEWRKPLMIIRSFSTSLVHHRGGVRMIHFLLSRNGSRNAWQTVAL